MTTRFSDGGALRSTFTAASIGFSAPLTKIALRASEKADRARLLDEALGIAAKLLARNANELERILGIGHGGLEKRLQRSSTKPASGP